MYTCVAMTLKGTRTSNRLPSGATLVRALLSQILGGGVGVGGNWAKSLSRTEPSFVYCKISLLLWLAGHFYLAVCLK